MKTAKEFKGTKGIWEVLFVEFENYDILCVAREDTVISQQTFGGKATEEMKANAHLIAAAPELLEELEQCVRALKVVYSVVGEPEDMINRAEKAISNALGL